jgi:hypothetical protein
MQFGLGGGRCDCHFNLTPPSQPSENSSFNPIASSSIFTFCHSKLVLSLILLTFLPLAVDGIETKLVL